MDLNSSHVSVLSPFSSMSKLLLELMIEESDLDNYYLLLVELWNG